MTIANSGRPTPGQVRAQLSRMLESKEFHAPERLKAFLSFVVEETLSGNEGSIKAYTIAIAAFGRNQDFDPQLDPIVRIEAGKLRKALELYFYSHSEDEVLILIPKGTYVPVFSYSQPGDQREKTLPELISQPDKSQKQPPSVLPEAVLEQEKRPVLLVLPFSMRGDDEQLSSFLAGLTDNLLAQVYNNEVVHILEAPVKYASDANEVNVVQLAREEGARFVLHGQGQSVGDAIRLFVALTDAQKGLRIWTEKYDSPCSPDNILQVQDDVSRSIFSTVLDSVGVISRTLIQETNYLPPEELGVYEASLRYIGWVTSFDRQSYDRAREALELNIDRDPRNPILLSQLSDIYSSDYQFAFNQIPGNLELAIDLAKKALSFDSNCHMAKLARALYFFLVRDKSQLETLLRGLPEQKDINPYVQAWVGLIIGMSMDLEEGKNIITNATRLNPYQSSCHNAVPFMYHFSKGDYEEALRYALLINAPACVWDPMLLTAAYAMVGQSAEMEKARKRLLALEPDFNTKRKQLLFGLLFDEPKVKMIDSALKKAGL